MRDEHLQRLVTASDLDTGGKLEEAQGGGDLASGTEDQHALAVGQLAQKLGAEAIQRFTSLEIDQDRPKPGLGFEGAAQPLPSAACPGSAQGPFDPQDEHVSMS